VKIFLSRIFETPRIFRRDVAGLDKRVRCHGANHDEDAARSTPSCARRRSSRQPQRPRPGGRIRNWFLTRIFVAGPLATTAYIVWWFVDTIDNWVKPLVPVAG
jgi:hypothetical protein